MATLAQAIEHVVYGSGARPCAHADGFMIEPNDSLALMRAPWRDGYSAVALGRCRRVRRAELPADGWRLDWTHEA